MNRYADPRRCPDCHGPIGHDDLACPTCRLPLRGTTAAELFSVLTTADALLAQLRATIFQFPTVRSAEITFDGSCDRFWNWIQRDCQRLTR